MFIALVAMVLCLIPMTLFLWRKLYLNKAYLSISIYWLINGLLIIPQMFQSSNSANSISLLYNLFDTPLVLLIFYYSAERNLRKPVLYLLTGYIVFEMFVELLKGHNWDSSTIISGTGALLILIYSFWGIGKYLQKVEHNSFESVMVFVFAGLIFLYGLFIVIYIFNYLNFKPETVAYNLFIYFASLILGTCLTSFGIWRFAHNNAHSSSSS